MQDNFDSAYKKCCNRLTLLSKLRHSLNSNTVLKIYQTMIQPIMTYTGILKLHFSGTQLTRMKSIERCVRDMTSGLQESVLSIVQSLYRKACKMVRQCLDKEMCTNFHDYFSTSIINEHNRSTRNMAAFINIPKVKLEFARQSFYFYGAKIYNCLPIIIRQEQHYRKLLSFK